MFGRSTGSKSEDLSNPEARLDLDPPILLPDNVTSIGSRFVRVSWSPVELASGYLVSYSADSSFINEGNSVMTAADVTSVLLMRRYGYIEKVFEVSQDYPQFWPAFVDDGEELSQLVREIDVLRNLLIWFRFAYCPEFAFDCGQ